MKHIPMTYFLRSVNSAFASITPLSRVCATVFNRDNWGYVCLTNGTLGVDTSHAELSYACACMI